MRFGCVATCWLWGFLGLALPASVRAESKPGGESGHHHAAPVYEVEMHDATGKAVTKQLDLRKADHKKEFLEAAERGEVHEIKLHEIPTIQKLASLGADIGLWTLLIFGAMFFILAKYAWPKILSGLQKREDRIQGALDEAHKARIDAQTLQKQFQAQMDEAQDKVRALLDEARKDAQLLRDEEMAKTRAEIQAERERFRREVDVETGAALKKIWSEAANLSATISTKVLKKSLDEAAQRQLINDAIGELKEAAAKGVNHHAQ